MQQYTKALKADAKYAPTYNSIGTLMISEGNLVQAKIQFEKAISLDPTYAQAIQNLNLL